MTPPIDMQVWQGGRVDAAEGATGRRWHQIMRPLVANTAGGSVVLVGFACDAGVARNQARVGAVEGPGAIRKALRNMPVHECELLADGGDVVCADDELEGAQSEFAAAIAERLGHGHFPIGLGGGHEIALASFSGLATHVEKLRGVPRIGIVNFDAHFDLRRADRGNSGTPFLQIAQQCEARGWSFRYACLGISKFSNTKALFERAQELGVLWLADEVLTLLGLESADEALTEFISAVDHVYLTFCLDVLPAAVAPGVSGPAARGVGLDVLEPLIDNVIASGKLRLADIAEMNPRFDIDGRTAAVAACIAARIANGVARGRMG